MPPKAQPAARSTWYAQMQQLFKAAEITAAAEQFDKHKADAPPEAILLRAWIHIKKNEHAAARALLQANPPPLRSKALRARHAILSGSANTMAGRFDIADDHFGDAERLLTSLSNSELTSELAWRRAVRYAAEGKIQQARVHLAAARLHSDIQSSINAAFAEQYLLSHEGHYRQQAQINVNILELISLNDTDHEESRIHAVWNLAVLGRELHLPDTTALVERHLDARPWPLDWTRQRFETLKALAWTHALQGDYFNAFRRLKQALLEARKDPSPVSLARECIAHLDRAYLARSNDERIFERQELEEASELAQRIDWRLILGEERVALLLLAELFARVDGARAMRYIAAYDELPTAPNRLQHFSCDKRPEYLANYSRAVVDAVHGHKKAAIEQLRSAYGFYERVGYAWRAGRCALKLVELTGKSEWRARAAEMLRDYGASWLARDLRVRHGANAAVPLPPMRRKVFDALCRGLSNAEIAAEMGRSEFTIRNHVKAIFKRFGVNSRSGLMAEALRQGLL